MLSVPAELDSNADGKGAGSLEERQFCSSLDTQALRVCSQEDFQAFQATFLKKSQSTYLIQRSVTDFRGHPCVSKSRRFCLMEHRLG